MNRPRGMLVVANLILWGALIGLWPLLPADTENQKVGADGTILLRQAHLWLPDETRGPLLQNWTRRDFEVQWVGYRCLSGYVWVVIRYQDEIYYTSREYVKDMGLPEPPKCEEAPSGGHIYGTLLVVLVGVGLYLMYRFSGSG